MNKVNLSLVVAPLVVKLAVTVGVALTIISFNVSGEIISSSIELSTLIFVALAISYPIGMLASSMVRTRLFSTGLMKMKRDSALGHKMFEAVRFLKNDGMNESNIYNMVGN